MGIFFNLGTLPQVKARPKEKENPQRDVLDVILLGHHIKGQQARSNQVRGPIHIKFESISGSRSSL
jgi:hypothetical protein